MAHGGHHGGHSYHHYHSRSRDDDTPLSVFILELVVVVIIIMAINHSNDISGKKPLEGKYSTYHSYLLDGEEYFSNADELVDGLKYFHEKTNVQIIVMSSNDSWSDSKAVEKYYQLFDDEAHILIIIPTAWNTSTIYYAIGDLSNNIVDDNAMNYLLNNIHDSKNGEKWKKALVSFTDKLLSE